MSGLTENSRFPGLDIDNIDFVSVFNRLDDGVIIADLQGNILFYNEAQSKIDGLWGRDVIGIKVIDIYELNNQTSLIMQCAHRKRAIKNKTFFYRTISGKVANTITSVYPLFSGEHVNGVICFVKDYELLQKSTPTVSISECRPDLGNGTRYTFADLIGNSDGFSKVIGAARKASASSSPIMIQGETGTGKELFAQAIHNYSWRHKKKFVGVNCAAIPHDLLEGVLFGTTKGAFTGALDKPGLFEVANGGTLFLDELLAMPLALQAKLLRVIQEKSVRRLGSINETDIDLKIISAVSEEPRSALRKKTLRMDLFYRLGVVVIKLPPLRDRREGMGELVSHFIEKCNGFLGTHVKKASTEVMELFMTYQWPGNIRELEHLIEGAMNMAGYDEILDIHHFSTGAGSWDDIEGDGWKPMTGSSSGSSPVVHPPPAGGMGRRKDDTFIDRQPSRSRALLEKMTRMERPEWEGFLEPSVRIPLTQSQAEQEKKAIGKALMASRGNVTKAAGILGISRQLLHYKIKKHGLRRIDFMCR